jgi:hypothetical protein
MKDTRNPDACPDCFIKEVKCPVCEQMRDSLDIMFVNQETVICKYCYRKQCEKAFKDK